MSRLPLRRRVVLASAVALAIGLGVLSVATNLVLASQLERDARSVLRARADAELASLDVNGPGILLREGPKDDVLDRQAWVFAGGRELQRAAAPAPAQRAAAALASVSGTREVAAGDTLLLATPVHGGGGRRIGTVVVGLSRLPYEHTERIALVGTIALDLLVLMFGAAIAWRAVGAALRPVADMTDKASQWGDHDLDRRFGLGAPHDELTDLAATLDGLLERIAASRRHERRFSSEMAHELRTPLTGVRGEVELALRSSRASEADLRAALERVAEGADRMEGVIDTLLAVARGETDDSGVADASDAAHLALAGVRAHAERRGVRLEVHEFAPSAVVGAGADVVAQALQPLLDNGVRHAHARVAVEIAATDGRVVMTVADDGPGLPDGAAEAVFEPGWRGGGGNGAGLGLALARRLAQSCGGDVRAEPSDGGARLALDLPAIPAGGQRKTPVWPSE